MAYFNNKQNIKGGGYLPTPIPTEPSYNPPPIPPVDEGSDVNIPIPAFGSEIKIHLYKNMSDNTEANKILADEEIFYIILKTDIDVIDPIIEISSDIDLREYNYCYINVFNRFYFATLDTLLGNIYRFKLHSDVLVNNLKSLLTIEATIERQEFLGNEYINDGTFVDTSKEFIRSYNFNNGFNDSSEFILITAGG